MASPTPPPLVDVLQKELEAHSSGIRIVLTRMAERIVRMEQRLDDKSSAVASLEDMLRGLTDQVGSLHTTVGDMQQPLQALQSNIQTLAETCIKLETTAVSHQSLLDQQAVGLDALGAKLVESTTTAVTTARQEIEELVLKADTMHDQVLQQIEVTKIDLATKLDDVTKKVEALDQDMHELKDAIPTPPPLPPVVVLPPETTKIPVNVHTKRLENERRRERGPFTDLRDFQIPDDMQARLEHNVNAIYTRNGIVAPPSPLPGDVNHLQCPEIPLQRLRAVDDSASGVADLRNYFHSRFHALSSLVESSRIESRSQQDALHAIMDQQIERLHAKLKSVNDQVDKLQLVAPPVKPALLLFDELTMGSVPSLRIALLELSRNLHVVRQTKKHMSVDMRRNLDKVIEVLNDAYHAMADDNSSTNLTALTKHTERVARALAFGMQSTIEILTTTDVVSTKELKNTIEHFSESLTCRLETEEDRIEWPQVLASLQLQVEQIKVSHEHAIDTLAIRVDKLKQRENQAASGPVSPPSHVQSRHEINERGKLLASFEQDLQTIKLHLQTRDAMLQKLAADVDHTARLVARYLPVAHVEDSKAKQPRQLSSTHKRLQALHPNSPSSSLLAPSGGLSRQSSSLSSLCVQNALKQPIRKRPITPPPPQSTSRENTME
ncbi:hypothetical protein AeMF1_010707 [Aphanomyces euteiches]|nr:hypothetical protein AeMF1_010707 [Aphanomyces euteiches]